ncbi:MAG TPA: hypothetical protein PKE45_21080, partial [Caldilineaceae bacterium]|nr:hypothetical protein [Caldilineaceae bacterium]
MLRSCRGLFARDRRRQRQSFDRLIRLSLIGVIALGELLALHPAPAKAITPPESRTQALPPSFAAPSTEIGPAPAPPSGAPAQLAGQAEIAEARTLNRAAFDLGDGRIALVQDTQPLNYQDEAGDWQPIEPTFQAVEGGWINTRNTLKTSVAQRGSQAKLTLQSVGVGWAPQAVQLVDANGGLLHTVAEPLAADAAQAGIRSADSRTIRYPQTWSAAAIEDTWQLAAGSASYSVRLAERPSRGFLPFQPFTWLPWGQPQWLELRVDLHLRPGTTVEVNGQPLALPLETSEPITFVDAQGERLLLQPPAVYEENQPGQRQPGRYLLRAGADPDTIDLRVRFDWDWLSAAGRSYPLILDPVFQTTSPFTAKVAHYSGTLGFLNNERTSLLTLGTFDNRIDRTLAHFEMPTLPPGTTIEQAFLAAIPGDAARLDEAGNYRDRVQAFALANSDWIAADTAAPALANQLTPYVSNGYVHEFMSYGRGRDVQGGAVWEITDLARGWLQNPANNHGVLLKMATECPPVFPFCNGFTMDYGSTFTQKDLSGKDYYLYDADGSGVKLIVVYRGPTLAPGQVISSPLPSNDRRFYQADHVYTTPAAPALWQAIVTRGLDNND